MMPLGVEHASWRLPFPGKLRDQRVGELRVGIGRELHEERPLAHAVAGARRRVGSRETRLHLGEGSVGGLELPEPLLGDAGAVQRPGPLLVGREQREYLMSTALKKVADQYEYVVIDCPPSLGLLTLNALTAADSVMIPVQCEYFALEGLGQLFNTINLVKKTLNPNLDIEGVLMTMFDSRLRLSNQIVEEVKRYFGDKVFETVVSRNIRLSEAPSFGKPIILYDAVCSGTRNYMELAREVMRRSAMLEQDPQTPAAASGGTTS